MRVWFEEEQGEGGGEGDCEGKRGEQRDGHGEGERAEEAAGDAGDGEQRQEDNDGCDGGADEGMCDFVERAADGGEALLAGVEMEDDVFDDNDGVVDDETNGRGEAAEGHEVEALADGPERKDGDGDGDGDDETRDEGGAPATQEEEEDDACEDEADEDGVAHAADAVANDFRLVVVGLEVHAAREFGLELRDGGGDIICDGDGVAAGLASDVEQDRRLTVSSDGGVNGQGSGDDAGHVADADGRAAVGGFDGKFAEAVDAVCLRTDEGEDELMVLLVQAGGVDDI